MRVTAAVLFVFCCSVCWSQSKPCLDLTLTPAEPDTHKLRSGFTQTANRVMSGRPSQTVDSEQPICPLTNSEKLHVFLKDSYSPFNAVAAAFNAAILQASQGRKGYGQGWDAYGSRFGAAFADNEASGFFQSFLFPVMLHQDPRYFRMRDGPVMHRGWYAVTRIFVTHNDGGRHAPNYSEILGGFAAAGVSVAYYPKDQRDAGDILYRAGLGIVTDAGWNLLKEFGPDISRAFHRHKKDADSKKDTEHFENVPRP
jgi:hypothetical protein